MMTSMWIVSKSIFKPLLKNLLECWRNQIAATYFFRDCLMYNVTDCQKLIQRSTNHYVKMIPCVIFDKLLTNTAMMIGAKRKKNLETIWTFAYFQTSDSNELWKLLKSESLANCILKACKTRSLLLSFLSCGFFFDVHIQIVALINPITIPVET